MIRFYSTKTTGLTAGQELWNIYVSGYRTPDPLLYTFGKQTNVDLALNDPEGTWKVWGPTRDLQQDEMEEVLRQFKAQTNPRLINEGAIVSVLNWPAFGDKTRVYHFTDLDLARKCIADPEAIFKQVGIPFDPGHSLLDTEEKLDRLLSLLINSSEATTLPAPPQKLAPGEIAQCSCGYQNPYYEYVDYTCTKCKLWKELAG